MRNSDSQQFQRKLQQFQSQNRQRENQKKMLQTKLEYKKLQLEYNNLWANYEAAQQQKNKLQETLQYIIPENQQLKKAIQQLKLNLETIHYKQADYLQQIDSKDRLIDQLSAQIQNLNQQSDYRKSDLSQMGELANSLQQKTKLQQQIQQLKSQRMLDNQNYQKKLLKKDEIIKSLNTQSQQNQLQFKEVIMRKISKIKELEEQKLSTNVFNEEVEKLKLNQTQYIQEIDRLNGVVNQLNQQLSHSKSVFNKENMEWQEHSNEMQRNIDEITAKYHQIKQEYQAKSTKTTQRGRESLVNNQKIQQLTEENNKLTQENQKLTQQYNTLRQQLKQSTQQKKQLGMQASLLNQQTNYLKHQQDRLNQQVSRISSEKDKITQEKDRVIYEMNQITQQRNRLNLQVSQLSQQVSQLSQQNLKLSVSLNELRQSREIQLSLTSSVSKEIQLKQHYLQLLQLSKKQLTANQLQLKNAFTTIQHKITELKLKDNQISQLKSTLNNNQQYQSYFQKINGQLQNDKTSLVKKLSQKDQLIKSLQNKTDSLSQEIYKLRRRNDQLQCDKKYLQAEKEKLKEKNNQQKTPSVQHFYDCNDQKQLLQQQLRETVKSLQSAKGKSEKYIKEINFLSKENSQLKSIIQRVSPRKSQSKEDHPQTSQQSIITPLLVQSKKSYEREVNQLRQRNQRLQDKLNQKSLKLQRLQTKLRSQYGQRIKALQQQIYRLSQLQSRKQQPQSQQICIDLKDDDLMIDDLDKQFQLQFNPPAKMQSAQKQLYPGNDQVVEDARKDSQKRKIETDRDAGSKRSQKSGDSRDYKIKYQQVRVQNDSLQAHLQRLSATLSQTREKLQRTQGENQKLTISMQQMEQKYQTLQKKTKALQKQLNQSKQQLQRFQTLKQLLKIQRTQSKQKSTTITQLQQKLTKLQRANKQLKQDYRNLQQLNQQTTQKYKKGFQNFKKQMGEMNEEILREKNSIQDKKKEMKQLQSDYLGRISMYQDENMTLKSRVKKFQLLNTKLEEKVNQLEQDQFEKVIITRTQFMNYKHTEKRLEELQEQINSLLNDKNKIITEKKSLDNYFEEQITLLKTNFAAEREKLLRRLTELELEKNDSETKLQKMKEIIQKTRKDFIQMETNLQITNKENYHIKLQLSEALSETNLQLVRNKTLGEKVETLENQIDQLKDSYQTILMEKSKTQKDNNTQTNIKVELQMAYKQIEKLNDVLMEKQRQINYLLTQSTNTRTQPTSDKTHTHNERNTSFIDKQNRNQYFVPKEKQQAFFNDRMYTKSFQHLNERSRSRSRESPYNQQYFVQPETQPHYKSSRGANLQHTQHSDFVKQPNYKYKDQKGMSQLYETKGNRNQASMQNFVSTEKYIGGFPPQFCTFSPEYHRI